jgi:hypothetical protein
MSRVHWSPDGDWDIHLPESVEKWAVWDPTWLLALLPMFQLQVRRVTTGFHLVARVVIIAARQKFRAGLVSGQARRAAILSRVW